MRDLNGNDIFMLIFGLLILNGGGTLKLRVDCHCSWRTVIILNSVFSLAWILVVMFVL
jgi:hypothetical protein